MDDLPRPANPTIDLGGIPASQDTFRSIRQFSVIDKVERQERHISMALNLGIPGAELYLSPGAERLIPEVFTAYKPVSIDSPAREDVALLLGSDSDWETLK